ncbi:LTA synthase family protein [Vicingaceae bacterium]|nr:LTA synthase family protein [Vicingaceae bacterium]
MKTFLKQNINLFKVYLLGLFLFALLRLVYLIRFGEEGIFSKYGSDIVSSFITGIRFDTQILCYSFALVFLLNFLLFIPKEKMRSFIVSFSKVYSIVILSLLVFIIFIDHQFYTYFQTHINILAYGFLEDDTAAVMSSVWSDHPIIRLLLAIAFIVFVIFKLVSRIFSSSQALTKPLNIIVNIGLVALILGLFGLGVRGSVGIFPLQVDDSTVSENRFINSLTLNGLFTLEKAIEEKNESRKTVYKADVLKNSGYPNIQAVLADYRGVPIDSISSEDDYFETTPQDSLLENDPPNVIFILMESFGGYYLNFHSEKLNLFGSLEQHLDDGVLFTNFLSSTQGTIYSLENIVINKNHPIVSNTNRRFDSFKSSIAFPYVNAGYKTTFITGGKLGWRNLQDFIPNQYFKESYGKAKILKTNPNATTNTWGVYDEFLFDNIFNQLNNKTPQMIFALSTTNHTPYEIPSNYKPYSIEISDSLSNSIMANKDIAEANFRAYQYANDCLGKFLTKLKASKFAENTIVAVSGDHNSYALFPLHNSTMEEKDNHIVPFFLSIPEKYKKTLHINEDRYGSHKDIFPTLINISLSNQKYFSLGNNLLSDTTPDSLFYGINDYFYFGDPKMPTALLDKKVKARNILNDYYFAQ